MFCTISEKKIICDLYPNHFTKMYSSGHVECSFNRVEDFLIQIREKSHTLGSFPSKKCSSGDLELSFDNPAEIFLRSSKRFVIFSSRMECPSIHVVCTFDNLAVNLLPKSCRFFAQTPKKNYIHYTFTKLLFFLPNMTHWTCEMHF